MTTIVASMAVEVHGQGDAVLMLHGLGGTSNSFTPLLDQLRHCRVVRPDLPGAGRSRTPETPVALPAMADGLARLIETLNLGRVDLVGHSLGTILCQMLAADRPDLVRSLCLFGALAEPPQAARTALRARAAQVRAGGMETVADAIADATLSATTRREQPLAGTFVRESLMRQCRHGYAMTCESLADAVAVDPGRIFCPALLVNGEEDAVAPLSAARGLADRIRGARAVALPRVGHWPTIEAPRETARLLGEFLNGAARNLPRARIPAL